MEFEGKHGRWVYEFKVIDPGGHLREVYEAYEAYIDARTGTVLSMDKG